MMIWKPLARSAFPNAACAAIGRWRAPGCTASCRAETAGGSRHRYLFPELLDFGEHGNGLGDFRTRRIVVTPERIERALRVVARISKVAITRQSLGIQTPQASFG